MNKANPSTTAHSLVPRIEGRIQVIRGLRVIIDADLATLYGVPTKVHNQAVKRNAARFPPDFMFQLDAPEKAEVVTKCDHLQKLKFSKSLPFQTINLMRQKNLGIQYRIQEVPTEINACYKQFALMQY